MTVTFRKITAANLESVLALRATPEQERFVSSIANSMVGPLDAPGMPEAARQQRLPGPTARFASDDEPMRLVEPKYSLKRARSWDTEKDPDGLIARARAAVSTTLEDETMATVENEATQTDWMGDPSEGLGVHQRGHCSRPHHDGCPSHQDRAAKSNALMRGA